MILTQTKVSYCASFRCILSNLDVILIKEGKNAELFLIHFPFPTWVVTLKTQSIMEHCGQLNLNEIVFVTTTLGLIRGYYLNARQAQMYTGYPGLWNLG